MARREHVSSFNWVRVVLLWLLAAVACLAFSVYVAVHWVERQVLNTDNWVSMVAPLPKQPVVSTALGGVISDKVFAAVPVQQKVADALPPRAGFLAGPLTSQLHTITANASKRVVASDAFQTVWTGANRVAMGRLLATARGQTPPLQSRINERFNVNLSGSEGQLRQALGKASEAIPALQPAAHKTIAVSTNLHAGAQRVHQYVRTADTLNAVLPWVAIASFLGAVALSHRRRRTIIVLAAVVIGLMFLELIAVKVGRQTVIDAVRNPANVSAVGYVFDTLLHGLKQSIYVVLAVMVLLIAVLQLAAPVPWAAHAREYVHLEQIRDSRVMAGWHAARRWVRRWEYYLWVGIAAVILGILALATNVVSGQAAINALLAILSLLALVHIIASPPGITASG